jgi:phosphoribosyl 1,2-cyclic phosphodiesterase
MQVKFWGTRGSIPKPGPGTVRYGGNTSCVEVRAADGTLIILDCGTGAHDLGQHLVRTAAGPVRGSLLISHTHWDHIQGIPFFAPFFTPGNEWDIYAPQGFGETLRTTLAGQMEYTYFPITADAFGASIRYHNVSEGEFRIGDVRILTRYLNHPALTIGYRIECDGAALVYACDHEPHDGASATAAGPVQGQDALHSAFFKGADLVIHDAQYTAEEYPAKAGWGHSTYHYAVNVCGPAGVGKLALTHHDPLRSDEQIDGLVDAARTLADGTIDIVAASEGMVIELTGLQARALGQAPTPAAQPEAMSDRLIVATLDSGLLGRVAEVAAEEQLKVVHVRTVADVTSAMAEHTPPLIVADGALPQDLLAAVSESGIPAIVIGGVRPPSLPETVEQIEPVWTPEYLRSRMRTWLMRGRFAHVPADMPEGEARRIAAVRALELLDTPREDRFDRLTRIASRMFDVPTSLITLVDTDRQWFKAKVGLDADETPRDSSFCAHAILRREPMVIPDALADPRFAGNPLVLRDPRIRFYAGVPLIADNQPVGTLCVIDSKPRALTDSDIQALRDLGSIVEQELATRG